ncbi:MAG: DUF6263 family protein [Elusimicrobia bacterium]|jgi:hypothetical protein|nr:DUF6263 family protein [Elusimicrobiota bacterium]
MKIKSQLNLTGLVAGIIILAGISCAEKHEPVSLKLNLEEGSVKTVRFTTKQNIVQKFEEEKNSIDQTLKMTYIYSVGAKDSEGNQKIDIKYQSISQKMEGDAGDFVYDSKDAQGEVPDFAKGYDALIGESFSVLLSPEGKVKAVFGIDDMIDGMIKKLAILNNESRMRIRELLKARFGGEAIKDNLRKVFDIYPEKQVSAGDVWEKDIGVSMGYPLNIKTVYTLKKISGDYAVIKADSNIESSGNNEAANGGFGYRTDFNGKQEGTLKVNIKTGWIEESEINQDIEGKLITERDSEESVIPMTIKGKTKVETLKE